MTLKSFTPILAALALGIAAVPAFAIDGADNPGTTYQQTYQPDGTPDQTSNPGSELVPATTPTQEDNPGTKIREDAPYGGDDNPGVTREEARALGREECQPFKANFAENKSAFGKCIAAAAQAIRNENISPRQACGARNLSRELRDGQKRSNFKACVLAVREARQRAQHDTDG
jgi:hypothetical protein